MNQIAIVILAAGNSKRMRQSKQLLQWGESTLLASVVANVLSANGDNFFVVLGAYSNEIREKINLSKTNVLINENWQQGLGSSIALATAEIDKNFPEINAVLFVLADQPFIESIHLDAILKLHKNEKEAIIITRNEDYKGVPVLFPKKYFSELMLLFNDEGAKPIINRNKNQVIEVICQYDTVDVDTFESYVSLFKTTRKIPFNHEKI